MTFLTLPPQDRSPQWIAQLTAVWEASVRATHHFLDEAAIQAIAPEVPQALRQVPYLTVAVTEAGAPAGFLGVAGHTLEMLFWPRSTWAPGWGPSSSTRGWRTATSPRSPSTSRTSGPWTSTSAGAIRSTTAPHRPAGAALPPAVPHPVLLLTPGQGAAAVHR